MTGVGIELSQTLVWTAKKGFYTKSAGNSAYKSYFELGFFSSLRLLEMVGKGDKG